MDSVHYVYEWWRMDLNLPYYVGKGKGKRAYEIKRNKHTNEVTNYLLKNGIKREVRIIARFVNEQSCFDFEIERIKFWWFLKDHKILTNQSTGGEGPSGYKHGPEQIEKMSKSSKGRKKSEEHRKNISKGLKGIKKPSISGEKHWLHNKGYLVAGENNPMFGKTGSLCPVYGKPTSQKQKDAARKNGLLRTGVNNPNYGKITPDDVKEKLSISNKGQKRSEEAKLKMRKPKSPEGRAAIAASNKARAEKKIKEKLERLLEERGDI